MRNEFRVVVETREDESVGHVVIEDITNPPGLLDIQCLQPSKGTIPDREMQLLFMFRNMADAMFRRCFPEYSRKGQMQQPPEQHGKEIIGPSDPRHSSNTGLK